MSLHGNLTRDLLHVVRQGIEAIESLPGDVYGNGGAPLGTGGIGAHMRHCLDFFDRLIDGVEEGAIDYDRRERDERVEVDRDYAVARMERVLKRIAALEKVDGTQRVSVRADADPDEAPLESTVARELKFVMSHTIHHYAIMAMYMRQAGCAVAPEFGVAPSTLRYWEESRRCAPSAG